MTIDDRAFFLWPMVPASLGTSRLHRPSEATSVASPAPPTALRLVRVAKDPGVVECPPPNGTTARELEGPLVTLGLWSHINRKIGLIALISRG